MIACVSIPGLELKTALRWAPSLALRPAALAPEPQGEPLLGPVTVAAEAAGVRPGMRLGEALATCPSLALVERDAAGAELAWEEILRALEDAGFAVEPSAPGVAYFETRGVERLYGGLEPALQRALGAIRSEWDARIGAATRRFAALAAASVASPGQVVVVRDAELSQFLAPLPLTLLPLERRRYEELEALGVRRLGQLAGLPGGAVSERLGPDGRRAWDLAGGGTAARVRGRRPPGDVGVSLEFPEAVANELTLRRALARLVEQALARPERRDRFVRKLALAARLAGTGSFAGEADEARPVDRAPAAPGAGSFAGDADEARPVDRAPAARWAGGSWRRTLTLREPSADAERIRVALAPRLADLPSPVIELRLELVELTEPAGRQLELLGSAGSTRGGEDRARLRDGLRQVRASTGSGSVCTVVEVAPWSRIPESRALLVPRDE